MPSFTSSVRLSVLTTCLLALSGCNNDNNDSTSPVADISVPTLNGFARLDAATFADGPTSGQFITGDTTGVSVPFANKQPVQGFSGALKNSDGSYTTLVDNGYGSIQNSADFLLRLYNISPALRTASGGTGTATVNGFVQLRDPNKLIKFAIVNQFSTERLLTGADFDPESIQRAADGSYWIGEEFGPFLLHFSADGVLLDAPIALPNPTVAGEQLRAPQNPFSEESSSLRIMNAVTAHAKAHGATYTPVFSPYAPELRYQVKDAAGNVIIQSDSDSQYSRGKNSPSDLTAASSDIYDVATLKAAGYAVVPYTVNSEADMTKLMTVGVNGLISDRPDLLYKAVSEFDANGDGVKGDYLLPNGLINPAKFDAQGHRGGRNLRPENTLPAFEVALDNLMNTLEFDNGITADGVAILKHDPYIESVKCRRADGQAYSSADEVLIKNLSRAQIQSTFICDNLFRGDSQKNDLSLSPVAVQVAANKGYVSPYVMPTTQDVFDLVTAYIAYYQTGAGKTHPNAAARVANAKTVRFNIETKINPRSDKDGKGNVYKDRTVGVVKMADTIAKVIIDNNMTDRADIQSFDFRTLLHVQANYPKIRTVYLWGDFPIITDPTRLADSDDSTNLQTENGQSSPWLAGLYWPYRVTRATAPQLVPTSGGFEGLAKSADGKYLYALQEKPLVGSDKRELWIHQFDLTTKQYTGKYYRFALDSKATAIGDFQMFNNSEGVIIERDDSRGQLDGYKKLIRIKLNGSGELVTRSELVNLNQLANPNLLFGTARQGDVGTSSTFAFPFFTIEDIVIENDRDLTILNDNNYPFVPGRNATRPDDNEIIRIRLPADKALK